MPARLFDRAVAAPTVQSPTRPVCVPDPGFDALATLSLLRDQLLATIAARTTSRWKEAPLFYFDRDRQTELESARSSTRTGPLAEATLAIRAALPSLLTSVHVRRVARVIDGLAESARALAPLCAPALELADLLAVPDDEVFVVLHPDRRAGFRLVARGIADVGQFQILLADAVTGDAPGLLPGSPVPARFVSACRDIHPATPGGVPLVAEARYQLNGPAALRTDHTLADGFGGCEHWLWPAMPLAVVPRVNGERIVLLGPPAFAGTWDVTRRFPSLAADLRLIETLSPHRVAERLAQITGRAAPHRESAPSNAA
jgi:hypothetical protein